MQIAICGSGLAGLATAYFLLKSGRASVTVFDPQGMGGGTSGVAAGLLHPYPGRSGKLSWRGTEGMQASRELIAVAGEECVVSHGMLRLCPTEELEALFHKAGREWWDASTVERHFPAAIRAPGLFVPEAMTLAMPRYLEGIWRACERLGGCFVRGVLEGDFDQVVLATGPALASRLGLAVNKGQLLLCRKPVGLPPFLPLLYRTATSHPPMIRPSGNWDLLTNTPKILAPIGSQL